MLHPARSTEERAILVAYLAAKIGCTAQDLVGQMPFEVAKVTRGGFAAGVVLYTNYRRYSIEMMAAGEPGWITRGAIQAAFYYPFVQLGCWQVLANVRRANAASRELQRRLGFTELCVIETGGPRADDVVLYGMSRSKCLWLSPPTAQEVAA